MKQPPQTRIGAVIQARIGSTRLPGKVLLPLPLGQPTTVLEQVIRRAQRTPLISEVIVATSTQVPDDAIAQVAAAAGASVFRGSEQDVLGRFHHAALQQQLAVVVRLTADNPAIDPYYLQLALEHHLRTGADYTLTTGLPLGTNLEIIQQPALALAFERAGQPEEREHVTPYFRRHPAQFQVKNVAFALTEQAAALRLTLDYPSDYALLHLLYSTLPADFGLAEVAALSQQQPWLGDVNRQNQQVRV